MTKQEYYDLLVKTSKDGGFPSVTSDSKGCAYRSKDGKKCAVGLLISDTLYKESMENLKISSLIENHDKKLRRIIPNGLTVNQLQCIQYAHDSFGVNSEDWNHEEFVASITSIFGKMYHDERTVFAIVFD